MSKAKLIGIAPHLVVKDVVATAAYYRDKLGFNIIGFFADPPVYAMVERDGMQIHFGKADDEKMQHNAAIRKASADLIIWVPEIEMFYGELQLKEVDITQPIVQRSYGREFLIRDCNGFTIMVCD